MKLADVLAEQSRGLSLSDGRSLYVAEDLKSLAYEGDPECRDRTRRRSGSSYRLGGDARKKVLRQV